jgi:hypothetical protein
MRTVKKVVRHRKSYSLCLDKGTRTHWAEEWVRIAREITKANDDREVIDEGWMIGWFANAIMVGYDAGYKAGIAVPQQEAYDEGYEQGYSSVREDAYENGYEAGYDNGAMEGYDEEYAQGYKFGDEDGYERGYEACAGANLL